LILLLKWWETLAGKYAYVVICRIKRTYTDMNRTKSYAIPPNSPQEALYETYHSYLNNSRMAITVKFGRGLLIDIHGHAHDIQQVELGYNVTGTALNMSDEDIINQNIARSSSIYSLSKNNKQNKGFIEILRGDNSFGTILFANEVPCIPHKSNPAPGQSPYFSGGYITETYGSGLSSGGSVDAIQMEFNSSARSSENRKKYAENVVKTIIRFLETNYNIIDKDS
ncbi:MAG: hypothetical protein M0P27_05225, partial [Bacteroidales bacterium]|nr:hypothetical protein [Bacteroidales bacterium]